MVPWKVFWVVTGGVLTLTAGILPLPMLLDVHPLIVVPATVALVVIVALVARNAVEYSDTFDGTTESERSDMVGLIVIAIVAHGAWIVTLQFMPQWWVWWPLVLTAASGVEYLATWSYEYVTTAKKRRGIGVQRDAQGKPLDDTGKSFAEALRRAGLGVVTVVGWEELRDGDHD